MLNQNMSSLFKDCKEDCNGGQGKISVDGGEYQVESVRLFPFLSEHYSSSFIKNICMVKIDTEVCKYRARKISGWHSVSIQIPMPNHIRLEVKTLISFQILPSNQVTIQR